MKKPRRSANYSEPMYASQDALNTAAVGWATEDSIYVESVVWKQERGERAARV